MKAKLAFAALLLVLVAAGFYWYSGRGTKLSVTDSILIGDFTNATGDPVFEGTLREALAVDLAQSPSLNLVSVEKVGEALRSLGRPAGTRVTREIAPKLCPVLGATVYLTGSVAKDGSGYSLRLDASRCSGDEAVAVAKSDAADKRQALRALGTAAADLRGKFGEEPASLQNFGLPLERATTASLDALAAFTEGRRLAREKGAMEAVPALKRAVELDPRFALAHSNLAVAYYNLSQNALAADQIRQAFELADRQTVRDRLHITTLYYDLATGDVQKAIASYKEWVRLYPRDDIAKGNLSSEYFLVGDYEQAASRCTLIFTRWPSCAASLQAWNARWLGRPAKRAAKIACWLCRLIRKRTRDMCRGRASCHAGPWRSRRMRSSTNPQPFGRGSPLCAKRPTAISRKLARGRIESWRWLRIVVTRRLSPSWFYPGWVMSVEHRPCWTT